MYVTPCMSICKIIEGICVGCGRTKKEICMWMQMDDDERLSIMRRLSYGKRRQKPKSK
jgi:predicted Fe-S protein YdhL (DUF1289 family)